MTAPAPRVSDAHLTQIEQLAAWSPETLMICADLRDARAPIDAFADVAYCLTDSDPPKPEEI